MKTCEHCEHWQHGYFNVITRKWETQKRGSFDWGNCRNPIADVETDGSMVVSRETEANAFCSNFEWRGGTAPAETIPDYNKVAIVMSGERELLKMSWEEMAIRERTRWIREHYGSDIPSDLYAGVHNE